MGLVLVLAIVVAIFVGKDWVGTTRLKVGNSEIVYSGSSTKADAEALGKALTDIHYLGRTKATTIFLSKDDSGVTLQFVVNDNAAKKANTVNAFTQIAEAVAPSIGGKPITLKLVNPELKKMWISKKLE